MAFKRIALSKLTAQTATSQGATKSVTKGSMAIVYLDVTLRTTGNLDAYYIQGSNDDGTDWFDIPFDLVMKDDATAAGGTVTANVRNINAAAAIVATGKFMGIIKHLPCKHIRDAWVMSTTPNFDFDGVMDLK